MHTNNSFRGHVDENGVLYLNDARGYAALLKHFAGKQVGVTVSEFRPQRSDKQRRYYWAVIVKTLADELGYTSDELHEVLKWKFLRLEAEPEHKRPFETVRSTTDLNTAEEEDFHDRIRMWAASDLGIVIALPNEQEESGTSSCK